MNNKSFSGLVALQLIGIAVILGVTGCSKASKTESAAPRTPKEAATQLQQVFVSAPPEVKTTATVAAEALRTADYEKAVQSLQAITARQNLSFEQGMAVQHSMVALENRLIGAAAAGDANAKRAYELLRQSRRN